MPTVQSIANFESGLAQLARRSTRLPIEQLPLRASTASDDGGKGTTPTFLAGTNLITAMVGAGIVSFPSCVAKGGWYVSPLVLLLCTWVVIEIGFVIDKIIVMCEERVQKGGVFSFGLRPAVFEDMFEVPFGKVGKLAASVVCNLNMLLVCGAFMILIGMSLEYLLDLPYRKCVIAVSALFVPLTLLDDMSVISRLSFVGVLASIVYVITIAQAGLSADSTTKVEHRYWPDKVSDVGKIVSVMLLGFTYQLIGPTVRVEMETPSEFPKAVVGAISGATVVYFLCGALGFYGFGNAVADNVLQSMVHKDGQQMAAGICLAMAIIMNLGVTFPMLMSCISRSFEAAFFGCYSAPLRLSLLLASFFVGLFCPYFLQFLGLVSSTLGVTVCILMPLAAYWSMRLEARAKSKTEGGDQNGSASTQGEGSNIKVCRHAMVVVVGVITLFSGTYIAVMDLKAAFEKDTSDFWGKSG